MFRANKCHECQIETKGFPTVLPGWERGGKKRKFHVPEFHLIFREDSGGNSKLVFLEIDLCSSTDWGCAIHVWIKVELDLDMIYYLRFYYQFWFYFYLYYIIDVTAIADWPGTPIEETLFFLPSPLNFFWHTENTVEAAWVSEWRVISYYLRFWGLFE